MYRRIFAAFAITSLGALAPVVSGWLTPRVHFNFGPNDHSYLEGYEDRWEIDPDGLATHWSSYQSHVRLPLSLDQGRFTLSYRFARVYGETAEVELRVNGVPADRFSARGGAYLERSVTIPGSVLSRQNFDLELRADSHERRNRGLRMDWFRLEPADDGGRVAPDGWIGFWSALLSLAFWLLARAALKEARLSLFLGASLPVGLTLYGAFAGPFPLFHMLRSVVAPALGLCLVSLGIASWMARSRPLAQPAGSLLLVVFVAAFLLRAGGLFHPLYYHPDLRAHAEMVAIVSSAGLDFWAEPSSYIAEQGVWTVTAMEKSYAFPFSPVFHALFVPFDLDFFSLVTAMKLLVCLLSALEVPIVFYLGRRLGGDPTGLWAAALAAVSPVAFSRLAFAFLAAVFAHWLDTLVLASLVRRTEEGRAALWTALGFLTLALGSYAGSLVSFGIFFPLFGLLLVGRADLRRDGFLLLAGSAGVALLVLAVVYREFVGVFLTELVPAFLAAESTKGTAGVGGAIAMLGRRYWSFYDGLYIPLIVSGVLVWCFRRPDPFLSRLLIAWGVTFLALLVLRVGAFDLFNRVKEFLWVSPWISLCGGASLAWMHRAMPRGGWVAGAYGAILAGYGIVFYAASIAEKFVLAR